MIVLMQCVGEAVAAKGFRGLIDWVPGGGFLYDVAGEAIRRLRDRKDQPSHAGPVAAIAVDPKGRFVATAPRVGQAKVWKPQAKGDWALHATLKDSVERPVLAFMGDGRLVVGGADGRCRSWWAEKNAEFTSTGDKPGAIVKLAASSDNRSVAAIDVAGGLYLWEPHGNGALDPFKGAARANAAAFSPNGKTLVSVGDDGAVYFWEMFFKNVRVKGTAHKAPVQAVAFNPAGDRLATADADGTIVVWSVPQELPKGVNQQPAEVP